MKAKLTAAGILVVSPENGTEAYALKKWAEDNSRAIPDNGWIIEFDSTISAEMKAMIDLANIRPGSL